MPFSLPVPTEDQEAKNLVRYMRMMDLTFHHSPNETGQTQEARRRASRMKAMGTSAGYPDYTIVIPTDRYPQASASLMFVELKRVRGSKTSDEQKAWIARLQEAGFPARICHGADAAKAFIKEVINERPVA